MIDRLFLATLTFTLLIGGTLAFGSAVFGTPHAPAVEKAAPRVVQLERVVVVGKRTAAPQRVAQIDRDVIAASASIR
jgi:hypothetical protein